MCQQEIKSWAMIMSKWQVMLLEILMVSNVVCIYKYARSTERANINNSHLQLKTNKDHNSTKRVVSDFGPRAIHLLHYLTTVWGLEEEQY